MLRRDAINMALRLDKKGVEVSRVYTWNQGATADSYFVEVKRPEGFRTLRNKGDDKALEQKAE